MEELNFVTITGINHYYGKAPLKPNVLFRIKKEPDNRYDSEAIAAELPFIGTIGYVANSTNTVYLGTVSAGRLYDKIGDYAYARVLFVTHCSVIAVIIDKDEIENQTNAESSNLGKDSYLLDDRWRQLKQYGLDLGK